MLFMNEWDIEEAVDRFTRTHTPHLATGATILRRLQQWTNAHSDGWAYWPKPCRAAKALMTLLQAADRFRPDDVSEAALRKACQPIRAFLTRQGVDASLIFGHD